MKNRRQAKILEIIAGSAVQTQEQLLEALRAAGISTTQATVSRDIKELGIVKEITGFGASRYVVSVDEQPRHFADRLNLIFQECVTGYDHANNVVVIHTMPALAASAASVIDALELNYVLGSVAGYDTLIVVTRDDTSAVELCTKIRNLLG